MSIKKFIYIIVVLLISTSSFSQSTKQRKLEQQRRQLKAQIEQMRQLLADANKKKISVLDEVETLNGQISARENLIKITNQQANLLIREINANQKKMQSFKDELKVLKKEYARMVLKSYKSKSQQSRIMFLLSSSNFLQAYKRLQYMKQYNEYRKEQAVQIQTRSTELELLNQKLIIRKKSKDTLVVENQQAQEQLKDQKKRQQTLMVSIRKKEGKYKKEIKKKQEQASAIDKAIEKLIREAIAKANKKAGKKATKKGSATTFALTPEDKKLADGFTSNKGKLPWPVGTGKLTKKFGRQPHPTLPNILINSSGVEIETRPGEKARAIFEGEVMAVQKLKGASKLVQIRHGNYMTVYYNLNNITVKEGQKVTTKQTIGEVRVNPTNGRAIMKFLIYKNTSKQNPQLWVYKM